MQNNFFSYLDKCPVCNSISFKEIYHTPYTSNPIKKYLENFYSGKVDFKYLDQAFYHLYECKECGLIFQNEIPNDILMEVLYEKWIDPQETFLQHQKNDDIFLYSAYAQEISIIIEYFQQSPSKLDIFDFGMGWGKWSLMAKGFGCNSYGIELSIDRIKYAKSNGVKVITWDEIPKHSFDFINSEQVFEHLSNPTFGFNPILPNRGFN